MIPIKKEIIRINNKISPYSFGPGLLVPGCLVLWSLGPLVPWSPRPLVPLAPWSSGSLVLWSLGPLVPWSSGPLVLWSFVLVFGSLGLYFRGETR